MGLLDKLTKKREEQQAKIQEREEMFLSLIRVYLQAAVASEPKLGITNINMLPDMRDFKRSARIPTQGRLGFAEKSAVKKILKANYGLTDTFCKEIDKSVTRYCKKQTDIQPYFFLIQQLTNDVLMVLGNSLQWKLRIPSFFRKMLHNVIEEGVEDIFRKTDWSAADVYQACARIRKQVDKAGFSHKWISSYAYPMLMIAKGVKDVSR